MFYDIETRRSSVMAFLIGIAALAAPAWAQHGGHGGGHIGGHHYGGHGFGHSFGHGFVGVGHYGYGHHYSPSFYGGYYGLGYGTYEYNSRPYSYSPRAYSYSAPPAVYFAPSVETPNSYGITSVATSGATDAGPRYQRAAESAFRSHHYDEAIDWGKRAAKEAPRDGRLFLLLSQTHLALGEYRDAASAARLGMSLLPTVDWGYVVKNFRNYYHDVDYVAHVRRLGRFIEENPSHADARFLIGYHWVFLGHPEAASRELTKAAELNPRDEWTTRLLEVVGGPVPHPRPASPEPLSSTSGSSSSADASIEYSPPQEFEKPLKSIGTTAGDHKHEEKGK